MSPKGILMGLCGLEIAVRSRERDRLAEEIAEIARLREELANQDGPPTEEQRRRATAIRTLASHPDVVSLVARGA